jgi:hypothetical protein
VFRLDEALKVYPHREPIDFRLNINGLALLVDKALGLGSVRALRLRLQQPSAQPREDPGLGPQRLLAAAQAAGAGPLHLADGRGGAGSLPANEISSSGL